MIAALRETVENDFYGPLFVGLALTVVVFQTIVLVTAIRRAGSKRARLPMKLHAIAGASIAALIATGAISVHAARALMLGIVDSADPSEAAAALSRGISGQVSAIPVVVSATLLASLLWVVGTAFTLRTPGPDGRSRSLPLAVLVGAGLVPVAVGAMGWSSNAIKAFAAMAGIAPESKGPLLAHALDVAREKLVLYARVSTVAIPVLAAIAVVLVVVRRPAGAASRSPRLPLVVSAAAAVLAALMVLETRPTAAENALPWPPTTESQYVYPGGPPTPDLIGPDTPDRAPMVIVFRDRLALDGPFAVVDFDDLESKLTTLRNNFQLLHPGEDFSELALIEADRTTSIARLTSVLRAVLGAGYYRPTFAFTATKRHQRPVLGKLERITLTGARIRIAYTDDDDDDLGEWKNAVPLRPQDFADYDAFARRLVELRRAGKPVLVRVDRPVR